MQARYYDPVIGRFYSNDPVDVLGHMGSGNLIHGFNRFAYGNNNPYKFTDPTGMAPEDMFKPLRNLFSSPQKQSTQLKQDAGALAKRAGEGAVDGAKIAGNATKESLGTASTVAGLVPGGQGVSIALAVADAALNDTMTSTTSATMSTLTDVAATDLATDSGKVKPTNKVTATIYAVSQIVGIVGGEVQAGNEAQNNKVDKDDE